MRDKNIERLDLLAKVAEVVEPVGGAKIASAVFYKNRIISIGTNRRKSDPLQKSFAKNEHSIYYHAEVDAIKKALRIIKLSQLEKCILYVCRVNKKGEWAMSKPCSGCSSCIEAFGIDKIVYTVSSDKYQIGDLC